MQTAGPALERKADIAAFLTDLEPRSVFFVDEIHRLPRAVEETFYPAMEDGQLPITLGVGAGAKVVTLPIPPFTLIGATTRSGLLTTPLRDRFGIQHRLDLYGADELAAIVARSASVLNVAVHLDGARAIAERSRGTPRVANRLLKRVRDYAQVHGDGTHRRRDRLHRARSAGRRPRRPGSPGPRDPHDDLRAVRRRTSRAVDARGRRARGAGHDRGRLRALPAPARLPHPHAARALRDAARLPPPRPRAAAEPARSSSRKSHSARLSTGLPSRSDGPSVHLPELRQPDHRQRADVRLSQRPQGLLEVRFRLPVRTARRLLPRAQRRLLRL